MYSPMYYYLCVRACMTCVCPEPQRACEWERTLYGVSSFLPAVCNFWRPVSGHRACAASMCTSWAIPLVPITLCVGTQRALHFHCDGFSLSGLAFRLCISLHSVCFPFPPNALSNTYTDQQKKTWLWEEEHRQGRHKGDKIKEIIPVS